MKIKGSSQFPEIKCPRVPIKIRAQPFAFANRRQKIGDIKLNCHPYVQLAFKRAFIF